VPVRKLGTRCYYCDDAERCIQDKCSNCLSTTDCNQRSSRHPDVSNILIDTTKVATDTCGQHKNHFILNFYGSDNCGRL
jgi:hypothetical protein